MKRLIVTISLFIGFSNFIVAQNLDSINVVQAKWNILKIAPQTKLKTYHFIDSSLFKANQYVSFLEIKNTGKKVQLSVGADPKTLITTSDFGKNHQAIAALNGTFFDIKNGGSVDYIRSNGVVVNTNKLDDKNQRSRHQQAAVTMENGKLFIKKWDNTINWEENLNEKEIMVSGPLLIHDQQYTELDKTSFTRDRHPRTVVGIKKNGNVVLLTVDGRQANSAGMSLPEIASLMKWLGCIQAINLDGGGSTTLWVDGIGENGVVNFPSDNKLWDHNGERKVANVILLKKKKKQNESQKH